MRNLCGQVGEWASGPILVGFLLAMAVSPLRAQDEADPARADSLRGVIQERFARQVQQQLGLTQEQSDKMRATALTWFAKRRTLEIQERRLKAALGAQMRPGIAADQDSVARLTDQLLTLKIQQVQSYRDELKEMTYLTPVQRAQFFIMRERLLEAIQNAQGQNTELPQRRRLRP
ncbi:MAG: Spy/CpxP family protein refolding chaperone [Gemmatimonadota bacterium]